MEPLMGFTRLMALLETQRFHKNRLGVWWGSRVVSPTSGGGGSLNGGLQVYANTPFTAAQILMTYDSSADNILSVSASNFLKIGDSNNWAGIDIYQGRLQVAAGGSISSTGSFSKYANLNTVQNGMGILRGIDNRAGVTTADGAAIKLIDHTVIAFPANSLFRVNLEIVATAFTSGTATYTITWTENGVSQTAVVTATALNVVTGIVRLAMPDVNTDITVQLTGVFTATVRISAVVEGITNGT